MKKTQKIFSGILIIELILVIILSFVKISWPNACTPDLLNPFGRTADACAQVITQTLSPLFYIIADLLILTIIAYIIYSASKKIKKK